MELENVQPEMKSVGSGNVSYPLALPESIGVKYDSVVKLADSIFRSPNPYLRKSSEELLSKLSQDVSVDYDNILTQKRIKNDQIMTNYQINKENLLMDQKKKIFGQQAELDNAMLNHKFDLEDRTLEHAQKYNLAEDSVLTEKQNMKYMRDNKYINDSKKLLENKVGLLEAQRKVNQMVESDESMINASEKMKNYS